MGIRRVRLVAWIVVALGVLAPFGCVVEERFSCDGIIRRECQDVCYTRCTRYGGCYPVCYTDCYDVCLDRPNPPGADAGADVVATRTCQVDDQCSRGQRCSFDRCVNICLNDVDCPAGWLCDRARGLCTDRSMTPVDASLPEAAVPESGSDALLDSAAD